MGLKHHNFGPGLAPDVLVRNGLVYLAYGTEHEGVQLVVLDQAGTILKRQRVGGFFNSFPRFSGRWLVLKGSPAEGFAPTMIDILTWEVTTWSGRVDGNWGIVTNGAMVAWMTEVAGAWPITFGFPDGGRLTVAEQSGAPDGLESMSVTGAITLRKDIRLLDPAVGGYAQRADDLIVGQYGFGTGIRFDGGPVRWLHGGTETTDPRVAHGFGFYAVASWGAQGVRLDIGTRDEFEALPLVPGAEPPKDPPPPVAPPVEPPKEPPVSAPDLPNYFAHVQKRWAEGHGGTTEAAAARFTRIIAHDLHFGVGGAPRDPRVGYWKKANEFGQDPDKLAFNYGHGIYMVDIVANAGASNASPSWQNDPSHYWFPVPPNNPSGWAVAEPEPGVHTGTPPSNPPPQNPPPSSDLADRLAALELAYTSLRDTVNDAHSKATEVAAAVVKLDTRVGDLEDETPPVAPFDPNAWEVRTPVKWTGVQVGDIVAKKKEQ